MIFSSLYGTRLDRELGTADSTTLFTTARRKQAINEAQEEWAEVTECLQRRSTLAMTGGTAEYDLNSTGTLGSSDFLRLSSEAVEVRYVDAASNTQILTGPDLPRVDIQWLNQQHPAWSISTVASSVQQLPQAHYVRVDGPAVWLGFWPVPSTGSSATLTARISYLARPAPMTSDTNEPFQLNSSVRLDLRPYHQALVHYGAAQLEKLRRDAEASNRQMQIFLGYVARFLQSGRRKGGRTVHYVHSYFNAREGVRDPRT